MLNQLNLRHKLFLLSGTGVLALLIAVLVGTLGIERGVDGVTEIGRHRLPAILALKTLDRTLAAQKANTYEAALWEHDTDARDIFGRIGTDKHQVGQEAVAAWDAYRRQPKTPEEAVLWERFNRAWAGWRQIDQEITDLILLLSLNTNAARQAGLFQQYYVLGAILQERHRAAQELLDRVIALNARHVEREIREAEAATRLSSRIMVAVGVAAILLLLGLDAAITVSILRQMGGEPAEAVKLARRIAQGDLSLPVPTRPGDPGSLLASLAHMQRHLRELFDRLSASERRFRSIFSNMSEGVALHLLEFDAAGEPVNYRIVDANDRYQKLLGLRREAMLGRLATEVYHTAPPPHLRLFSQVARSGEATSLQTYFQPLDKHFDISVVPWEGQGFATIVTDITERKRAEERLHRIAHYDALTQLPNRVLLADRLTQAMARAIRGKHLLAVCHLDLDGFKPVNDRLGHEAGDRLLVEIATRLKASIRGDDTVARLGGDEFIVLLGSLASPEECRQSVARILALINEPCELAAHHARVAISASAGVTIYPADNADPDTLLRHVDQAMYRAKQAGRNRFHQFDPVQDRQVHARHEALSGIADALDRGEFRLYYQPKVDMRAHRVVGAEALIRWQHPERGLVPPGEFLPVLEGSDLNIAVGDWVLHEALRQMDAWRQAGYPLAVSVNISSRQIEHPDFSRKLHLALGRHPHLKPEALELEILESAALDDIALISSIIGHFKHLGVGFALDDFGTGYSSLAYLKRVPAQTLKIDQTFVRDMLEDPEDQAIVEGIIGLASVFRRKVIAEGVETAAHGRRLMQLGCDLAQGYGISRPLPAEQFPAWIDAYHAAPPGEWRAPE